MQRDVPPDAGAAAESVTVLTEPLGGSALSRLIQSGGSPEAWGLVPPSSAASWRDRAATVRGRFAGVAWLDALGDAISRSGAGRDRLRRVAAAGGVLVTTGQQPGLFGGPIYTWSKALSALALANRIEATLQVPAAPLFWAATDDADLAEAQRVWIATPDGAVELRGHATAEPGTPAALVPQGPLDAQLEVLRAAAGSVAHPALLGPIIDAYADPSLTIGDAYLAVLEATLEPLGIPVLDASHPAVHAAADPLLRRALEEYKSIDHALARRGEEIRATGLEPQVEVVAGLTPVFGHDARGVKRRIRHDDAVSIARRPDMVLGPNVLLRPLVEASILPTVAYVAGPGELAYFAQVSALADALEVARPVAVPRWSGTLVEPRVARVMARLGVTREEFADPHATESASARAALPAPLGRALTELNDAIEESVERTASADTSALVPAGVLDGFRGRIRHEHARLERRILAAVKRREASLMQEIAFVRGFFFPGGKRQERALTIVPTLARYGPDTLRQMAEHADAHAGRMLGTRPAVSGAGATA